MRSRLLTTIALLIAVSACRSTPDHGTHGANLDESAAARIQRGMTQGEVKDILGDPTRITTLGEGRELWAYRYQGFHSRDGRRVYKPIPPGVKAYYTGAIYVMFSSKETVTLVRRG